MLERGEERGGEGRESVGRRGGKKTRSTILGNFSRDSVFSYAASAFPGACAYGCGRGRREADGSGRVKTLG